MKTYNSENIKNVVLVGHSGSGKTTLAECMLFEAGAINRRGTVADTNSTSDFNELEHERGYSCLLYTSPSPRDRTRSRMPSSA